MTLPYRWYPEGTTYATRPYPGDLVARDHAVWRVISVTPRPPELWTEESRERVRRHGDRYIPHAVVLRPVDAGDDPKHRGRDLHIEARGAHWDVFRSEHYPICAKCSEPRPCREEMAERVSAAAAQRFARYETPGICPACEKPVTARQKSMTFADNLEVLGGPPVTFHVNRAGCTQEARRYEERWVAADPQRRRAVLSCVGSVINHNDGTYECSELAACPGPAAAHRGGYTVCRCPDCHAGDSFDCHPAPTARLLRRDAS